MHALETEIRKKLLSMKDAQYAQFQRKLMPTVDPVRVIGVRIPDIRRLAKTYYGTEESKSFLAALPHALYDEDNLHGALLDRIPDFDTAIHEVERFLPYIDNWATCDLFCPKILLQKPDSLLSHIKSWLRSDKVYTVRYGLVRLTAWYLDDARFTPEILSLAAQVRGEDYYINMAQAWFFSMALAKQYDATIPYLTEQRLDAWVHNKAIQKAIESYQISTEIKAYLKTLKRAVKGEPT
ncbi:MAG: DNA alkylation repair protein [Clostridia bacterium]|nr:DNA alkylation repair protein [Clostridia bacterium]